MGKNELVPDVAFVVSDTIFFKERAVFFLKSARPMVFLLSVYVVEQLVTLGWADGKCAVTALPGEGGQHGRLRFDPSGGGRFQGFNQSGHGDGAGEADGEMNVISDTTDTEAFAISIARNRREITVERRTNFRAEERHPVFGAENDVDQK